MKLALALLFTAVFALFFTSLSAQEKIPVIYDSDIGDDIDDTWAVAMLLKSPELDVKMVIGDHGRVEYRTKLFAKLLERAVRVDVPIGKGVERAKEKKPGFQQPWVEDYDLKQFPGTIHQDGIGKMIEIIMTSPKPVTVIAVGPVGNIAEALRREPKIAAKANFIGMHGSVRLGYNGAEKINNEYNVKADVEACRVVFAAPWREKLITPLDTCGLVTLKGEDYQQVYRSKTPAAKAVMENYAVWLKAPNHWMKNRPAHDKASSVLFDTVAVYLAFDRSLVDVETIKLSIDDEGYTRIDQDAGAAMQVATKWNNLKGFESWLAGRLAMPTDKGPAVPAP